MNKSVEMGREVPNGGGSSFRGFEARTCSALLEPKRVVAGVRRDVN